MQILKYKVDDRLPIVIATVKDSTGTVVDISSYTSIKFSMCADDRDRTVKIDKATAAFYTDGTDGKVKYEWASGDLDTAGEYLCEFLLEDASSKKYTLPKEDVIKVQVVAKLGT